MKNINALIEGISEFVIKFRYVVVVVLSFLVFSIWEFSGPLTFANSYEVFFSKENPDLEAFNNLQATYSKNDNFLFVIEPEDGKVFTKENLKLVKELTAEAWKLPFSKRVDSITNFQYSYGLDDNIVVEDLISEVDSIDQSILKSKKIIALSEPLLVKNLITEDASVTAINVVLQYPGKSIFEVPTAAAQARLLRNKLEEKYKGVDISLSGVSMLNNAFSESGYLDSINLIPKMYMILIVITLLVLRSFFLTVSTLIIVACSAFVGMGFGALVGIQLTPISNAASIIILTLAIADSIHILTSLKMYLKQGLGKKKAICEAISSNFLPVTVTSITTIVGFLALNFSDSPPFWHLGNMTAVGIFAAWFLSLIMLPALVAIFPLKENYKEEPNLLDKAMEKLSAVVISKSKYFTIGLGLVTVLLVIQIPNIEYNDQWRMYFSEKLEFRQETDKTIKHFGMYPIEYSIPALGAEGISDPEYLQNLNKFTAFLREQNHVVHVFSLTDIFKRLNKNIHANSDDFYSIPKDKNLSQQTLLLYELSLPYGLDLNDRVNVDKSASRVTVTLTEASTIETKEFLDSTNAWIRTNLPEYMQNVRPTSAQVMFTYITDRNVESMIIGMIVAVIAIAIILAFALKSITLGFVSLIPNSLPIFATFGFWALIDGEVGFSVAAVASISLGIIVDDTVHFLSRYIRARDAEKMPTVKAIRYSFVTVGKPIIYNTLILAVGFFVMATSTFKINADLGLLTMITILFALVFDLFLLPSILLYTDRFSRSKTGENVLFSENVKATSTSYILVTLAILILFFLFSGKTWATSTEAPSKESIAKGYEVSARSDRSDNGFGSSEVALKMVLTNAAGEKAVRTLKIMTLERDSERVGDKSLIVFETPFGMEGTALLSHAKIGDPDSQWIYLPSLKRVKRLSTRNKSGPFVGSEFAFEDFTGLELNKYSYEWLREEACGDLICDVVARYPLYEFSGYSKQISWVDQKDFQVRKVTFYDRKSELFKVLNFKNYKNYDGVFRSHELEMINYQTNKQSTLIYDDYVFSKDFKNNDFEKGALKNLR